MDQAVLHCLGVMVKAECNKDSANTKTPVAILQEVLAVCKLTAEYELLKIEDVNYSVNFKYKVFFKDCSAFGNGRTKLVARHNSAKNMLAKLVSYADNVELATQPETSPSITTNILPKFMSYDANDELLSQSVALSSSNSNNLNISENAIGKLQEYCVEHCLPMPVYTEVDATGQAHNGQFTISCSVHPLKVHAAENSKKLAKHKASQKMWLAVNDAITAGTLSSGGSNHAITKEPVDLAALCSNMQSLQIQPTVNMPMNRTTNNLSNPIGMLQELCVKRCLPVPKYCCEHESGPPHMKKFTVSCSILTMKSQATDLSKKQAKHVAAEKMWQTLMYPVQATPTPEAATALSVEPLPKIKETHSEEISSALHLEIETKPSKEAISSNPPSPGLENEIKPLYNIIHDETSNMLHRQARKISEDYLNAQLLLTIPSKDNVIANPTELVIKLQNFMKNSISPKAIELLTLPLNEQGVDYVQFLEELCQQESLHVTFMDVKTMSEDGNCRCLVQINLFTSIICSGTGAEAKNAQQDAARNALEYFKLMSVS